MSVEHLRRKGTSLLLPFLPPPTPARLWHLHWPPLLTLDNSAGYRQGSGPLSPCCLARGACERQGLAERAAPLSRLATLCQAAGSSLRSQVTWRPQAGAQPWDCVVTGDVTRRSRASARPAPWGGPIAAFATCLCPSFAPSLGASPSQAWGLGLH